MHDRLRRAVILGGTGALGAATALRLARHGWMVDVAGRSPASMPPELTELGVRFHAVDRSDARGVGRLVGDGCDLLVDLTAFTAEHVEDALPAYRDSACVVLASSRAVYIDADGQHINGDTPPCFPVPLSETQATLAPAPRGTDPYTREGYAPSKVAVEHAAFDSGLPVTVVRPSKVHGRWARNARTRPLVERMLSGAETVRVAGRADAVDHLTAAANAAALIELVADDPGSRILNVADPDPLNAGLIAEAIARSVGWHGDISWVSADAAAVQNPWNAAHPIVLDTAAAERLGYRPVGRARELIADEATWVAASLREKRSFPA